MKTNSYLLLITAVFVFLSGCATLKQPPIPYDEAKIDPKVSRIGIAPVRIILKPNTLFPGAECLLCAGMAELAHIKLTDHVKNLPIEDLTEVSSIIHDRMQKRGLNTVLVNEIIEPSAFPEVKKKQANFAFRDFSSLIKKYDIDKLLLIRIDMVGIVRQYRAGYFPSGPPKVQISGMGTLINLADGSLEWFLPINVTKGVVGEWDEPPSFPGLTNAYFETIEVTKDTIINTF